MDYRIDDKAGDALTKNDHFRALLEVAHGRGFMPECVVFDSWYRSLENLKQVRDFGWVWLTRLKANRLVNPDRTGLCPVARVEVVPLLFLFCLTASIDALMICQGTTTEQRGAVWKSVLWRP